MLDMVLVMLLVATPIYLIVHWILKRYFKKTEPRWMYSLIWTLVLAPIIYVTSIIGFFTYLTYEPQYDFDQVKWNEIPHQRHSMRDDIVDSQMLLHKRPEQVIELLGEPTLQNRSHWQYDLGMSSGGLLGWQFNYLELKFIDDQVDNVNLREVRD